MTTPTEETRGLGIEGEGMESHSQPVLTPESAIGESVRPAWVSVGQLDRPQMSERGLHGQIMDALWPEAGGDIAPAGWWADASASIHFALTCLQDWGLLLFPDTPDLSGPQGTEAALSAPDEQKTSPPKGAGQ